MSENYKRFFIKLSKQRFLTTPPAKLESFNRIQNEEFQWKFAACFWHHNRDSSSAKSQKIEHKHCKMSVDSLRVNYKELLQWMKWKTYFQDICKNQDQSMLVLPLELYNLFSFHSICLQKKKTFICQHITKTVRGKTNPD